MDPAAVVVVLAHLGLLGIGIRLIVVDIATHRLPDRIVLPALGGALLLALADAVLAGGGARLLGALWGMLILGGFYALLRALSREGMGGGDVKLAAVIGLVLGWHGGQALLVGAASAFVLGAVHALWLIALRRATGSTRIAFGPWMILGSALGVAAA
ncbi:A24 family peptidase [Microbacterium sp. 13-71-7]|jgi:leader peptidase (prepilin peptidase)/N-methyltransferase|uniref:prepilin peptidase n=1 Tax=Microbacterium sp. 13-71-7 TaxID=1970399 RepID=UPI000BC3EBBE|nr:A24 family peptidase [Microbacterium sp. 13-71-7]OZB81851.1 MAG: prepilin peptidase [Microbacterium sp. 13-71-7]